MCRAVRRVSTQTTYPSGYRRVYSEYPCAALRPQWMMCRAGAAVHRVPRAERLPGSAPRPLCQPNDLRQMLSRASECHPLLPPESTTATPDTATHAHAHTHARARTHAHAHAHRVTVTHIHTQSHTHSPARACAHAHQQSHTHAHACARAHTHHSDVRSIHSEPLRHCTSQTDLMGNGASAALLCRNSMRVCHSALAAMRS